MRYERQVKEIADNTEKLQSLLQEYADIRVQLGKTLYGELESERLMRIGKAEGRAEGRTQGRAEGESLMGSLITKLFAAGRISDAELAAKDEEARKRFYKEFGMVE